MVASSSSSSSSSSTSPQDHHSLYDDDLDATHSTLHNPTGSEYQVPSGSQIQATTDKQYGDDTSVDKNPPSITNHESLPQGDYHYKDDESNNLDNDNDSSSTVTAFGRRFTPTSSPSDDTDAYTDADSTFDTPSATPQQQFHMEYKVQPMSSNNTTTSIGGSQRKRSNTISSLASLLDTSSLFSTGSRITSASNGRPRSTSLVIDKNGMNPAALALHLCDLHPNADTSCPTTLGTKVHSDHHKSSSPTLERPSDAFRNRQGKRPPPYHHELSASASASTSPSSIHHNQDSIQQLALKEEISNNLAQLKETSTEVYDWEFWATVIHQFDQVNQQQHQSLRDHVCSGMPPSLRGMIWQVFSKSRHNSDLLELEYRELLNGVSPHEKIIQRDLARTFPTHTFFRQRDGGGQEMLFNVVKAYSLYDPQVGYCQGLPFIVGCLLLHMPDEAAFCVLVNLMNDYGLRGHFTPKMDLLHERLFQYEELLIKHLPQVYRHLDAQGVRPTMYASQWFMTLFTYRCPLDLTFRVLDMVFTEGTCIILNVALALLKKNQATILGLEFEGLLGFLGGDIFDAYQDTPTEFVKDAFTFHISLRDLAKLSKRYMIKAARTAKMQDSEDYLRAEHYELTQQAKKLEKSLMTLEQEHEATAKQVIESKMAMATASDTNQKLRHDISQLEQQINRDKDVRQPDHDSTEDEFNRFAQENAHLEHQNSQFECHLADIEATLIDFKLKYAKSENEYEQMKDRLGQIRNGSS